MEVVSPKSAHSSQRNLSRGFRLPMSPSNSRSAYGFRDEHVGSPKSNIQDVSRRLDNLLYERDPSGIHKISFLKDIRNKRPYLVETEQKIFSEIVGLVDQIDELKESIITYQQDIKTIQIEHPDIEEQVRYHGYSQPLTMAQYEDLEEENNELIRQLQTIESRSVLSFEEVLKAEQQKYQELKQQLAESSDPEAASKAAEEKVKELKILINQLENDRKNTVSMTYPGIDRLKTDNEELRQKTIHNLKMQDTEYQQQRELTDYLKREEANRNQFVHQLQKFKAEFKRIKAQNQTLSQRLERGKYGFAKENSYRGANEMSIRSKDVYSPSKSQLPFDSNVSARKELKRGDKLSEYQSFLKLMQQKIQQ